MDRAVKEDYADVNGLRLYYSTRGTGRPLVLIHGGAGVATMFDEVMPVLGRGRRVISGELQAHGHTADINRPMRYETMADDIAALIKHLKLDKVDLMGYSLGGGVALRVAIQHPSLVNKLVLVSAACKRQGWLPEVLVGMAMGGENPEAVKQMPMYADYERVAPRVEDWPVLMKKLSEMLGREYDWSEDVSKMKIPVLLAFGDADSVRVSHATEFFQLLGGGKKDAGWDRSGVVTSRLLILPNTTHYEIFRSGVLATAVSDFLDSH